VSVGTFASSRTEALWMLHNAQESEAAHRRYAAECKQRLRLALDTDDDLTISRHAGDLHTALDNAGCSRSSVRRMREEIDRVWGGPPYNVPTSETP